MYEKRRPSPATRATSLGDRSRTELLVGAVLIRWCTLASITQDPVAAVPPTSAFPARGHKRCRPRGGGRTSLLVHGILAGHGRLFVQEVASGKRAPVATTARHSTLRRRSRQTARRSRSAARRGGHRPLHGDFKGRLLLTRLTVGRFYDNLSPTYSLDGQRIAFVSTRPGLPQIYVMAADGTDPQLFAPFD